MSLQGSGLCFMVAASSLGGVAEWSKAAVLKTAGRKLRGFESYRLRHSLSCSDCDDPTER